MTAISDFDLFARVARTGNMSAAGRDMGLSPAVVSKRLSLVEERLGARLFQRTTRQLTLTETGEGYFKRVIDILSLVEEAEDFVSRRNTKPRGQLKGTAPTSFSRLHVAPHLPRFLARCPEIQLDFHLTDNFVDIIREGFDVAIRIGELSDSSLVARKLSPDSRVICAAPGYLQKAGMPQTLAELGPPTRPPASIRGTALSWPGSRSPSMRLLTLLLYAATAVMALHDPAAAQNAESGKRLFEKCLACHA